ncbi:MAG: hypothetical protein R2754_03715 [Microthrixaceae bacterium]
MTTHPSQMRRHLTLAVSVALALLAGGCADTESDGDAASESPATVSAAPAEGSAEDTSAAEEAAPTNPAGGGVNQALTRDDVDCTSEGLGGDDDATFTSAYYVVDGDLGAVCFGEGDSTVEKAWRILADFTPPGQLNDLALFAGFDSGEQGDEVSLAFVNSVDDDSLFQMSVNVAEADADAEELTLTLAHEFSHVFTAIPSELDRDADPDSCATYWSGEGCYVEGGLMANWIDAFWRPDLIEQLDPEAEATAAEGQERCDLDPQFFGAYGASNPEEDFAESFSAFVLRVPSESDAQQAKLDWIAARPGLAEFRDRAESAGYGPQEHNFDPCGQADG